MGALGIGVLLEELRDQAIQTPAQQSMRQAMQQSAAVKESLMDMRLWPSAGEVKVWRAGGWSQKCRATSVCAASSQLSVFSQQF